MHVGEGDGGRHESATDAADIKPVTIDIKESDWSDAAKKLTGGNLQVDGGSANKQLVPALHIWFRPCPLCEEVDFTAPVPCSEPPGPQGTGAAPWIPVPGAWPWQSSCQSPGSQGETKEPQRIGLRGAWRCLAPNKQRPQDGQGPTDGLLARKEQW